jgi:hypothetical protein
MEVTTFVTRRINYHIKNKPASSTQTGSNINHAISEKLKPAMLQF